MLINTLKALFNRDLDRLKSEIEQYQKEENLWKTEGQISNSAGNLCLHLIGNLNTYIGKELGKTGYIRNRDLEFSAKNIPKQELIKKIENTIETVGKALDNLDENVLQSEYPILVFEHKTSTEHLLVHLLTHLSYHLGQINYHRRFFERMSMRFREATIDDIKQIQLVRNAVKENALSNPDFVTDEDCRIFLTERGKGWVCEIDSQIVGFSIADIKDHNIWALFVHPDFDKMGIGRKLHSMMLDWYFSQTKETVWLGTAPNTRAETFYRKAGWKEIGTHGKGEVKFEMIYNDWINQKRY